MGSFEFDYESETRVIQDSEWFCRIDLRRDELLNILRYYFLILRGHKVETFELQEDYERCEDFDYIGGSRSIYLLKKGGLIREDTSEYS
jgi:hypothetical protein